MYHNIQDVHKKEKSKWLNVPIKRFDFQMKILKLLGYKGLSLKELQPYLTGELSGKVIGITFDDGYKNNLTNALPILKKYNFSATCYIVSDNIGGFNYWDVEKGISKNKMMNKNDIMCWLNSGMDVGSHCKHHIKLSKINKNMARDEIVNSKLELEKKFNIVIDDFSYPYGNFDKDTIKIVKDAKYKTATTTIRSRANKKSDIFLLPRITISHNTFPYMFLLKLFTKYEDKK